MPNALKLLQTSPASNPDRNLLAVTVSGAYVNGTADALPLTAIADPGALGQVPLNNPGAQPPPVTPRWFGCTPGYYAQVQRTVDAGATSFGLRWFDLVNHAELASGNYPAAIAGGESFLEVLVPTFQNT